ncbi:MAG: hypothetical protein ABJD68_02535 [Nakamurella sp.]
MLVSIGTFNQPSQAILWAGVSPTYFLTMTVTEQQANGDPESSGRVVLQGTAG